MRTLWEPILRCGEFVVVDGGLATELERRGADLRDPLWSAKVLLEKPALIAEVHDDYLKAGADVITTASYQATFEGFAGRGLKRDQIAALLLDSVRLACEARDGFWADEANRAGRARPLVAASIGCYGASLHDGSEFRGDYKLSAEELADWHAMRLEVLDGSGADLFACETVPCRVEAEALVDVLAAFPGTPAWLSFSCKDATHVCHGETFAECVALAEKQENIVAVGINCTAPELIEPLLRSVKTDVPLVVYPNSGETWDAGTRSWRSRPTPLDWSVAARSWHDAGARLIGGCCRTTPETIAAIRRAAQRQKGPS